MIAFNVLLVLFATVYGTTSSSSRTYKRSPAMGEVESTTEDDSKGEETGFEDSDHFGGFDGGGGGGRYFMDQYFFQPSKDKVEFGHVSEDPKDWEQRYEKHDYNANRRQGQHVPQKDHYEFGYKRGNEHHHKERHEKAHPHAGHFKTKVKWGDIHGGHGEHYWDYNHHGKDEEESDEASEQILDYEKMEEGRKKRDEPKKEPVLMYNPETGTVKDETTGRIYALYEL